MADNATPAAGRGKTLLVVALVAVLAAAGAAGAAWFVLGRQPAAPGTAAPARPATPLYTSLEPITVNLQDPRGERFAQVAITLQFEDPAVEKRIKDHLPTVRNDILLLVASKQIEELISSEGKRKLAEEIRARTARAMGVDLPADGDAGKGPPNPIRSVLFSQFIVQ